MLASVCWFLFPILIAQSAGSTSPSTGVQPPVTLTISGPSSMKEGETITIHESLTNVSRNPVVIALWRGYTAVVHDNRGIELQRKPGDWRIAGSVPLHRLMPGETVQDSNTVFGNQYELKPGRYTVEYTRPLDANDPSSQLLESNKITINVIASGSDRHQ